MEAFREHDIDFLETKLLQHQIVLSGKNYEIEKALETEMDEHV